MCAQRPCRIVYQRPISARLVSIWASGIWHSSYETYWVGWQIRACAWKWKSSRTRRGILLKLLSATANLLSTSTHCQSHRWRWWLNNIKPVGSSCQNPWGISGLPYKTVWVSSQVQKWKVSISNRLLNQDISDHLHLDLKHRIKINRLLLHINSTIHPRIRLRRMPRDFYLTTEIRYLQICHKRTYLDTQSLCLQNKQTNKQSCTL